MVRCRNPIPPVLLIAGKWQGALVAIKVVEHRLRKSLEEMDEARESLLSASVSHPNVVRSETGALPGYNTESV